MQLHVLATIFAIFRLYTILFWEAMSYMCLACALGEISQCVGVGCKVLLYI
jgi:hypothetical protein